MEVGQPKWYLAQLCPICEQGSSLLLVRCPQCGHIAIECAEEGTFFPDPRALDSSSLFALASEMCPRCAQVPIHDFAVATSDEIQAAAFRKEEYY